MVPERDKREQWTFDYDGVGRLKRVFQNPDISFLKQIMAHRSNVKAQ